MNGREKINPFPFDSIVVRVMRNISTPQKLLFFSDLSSCDN